MGLYRATLNMPWARRNQTAEFDDYSPEVKRLVMWGHLVPIDEKAQKAQEATSTESAEPRVKGRREAIREAMVKAREEAGASVSSSSEVTTSIPKAAEGPDVTSESPEVSSSQDPHPESSATTPRKKSAGIQRKGRR